MNSTLPLIGQSLPISDENAILDPDRVIPPPCFYWKVCATPAIVEKVGRSVCSGCAARLRGLEYPLRSPSPGPIYLTSHVAAESLDMVE